MSKKIKFSLKKIVTHSGTFHCDDALACFLLKKTALFGESTIVRTRDPAVIKKADVVVDVGGEFDRSRFRFDHHQKGFNETFSKESDIKLSSAGLVYKYFGKEILGKMLGVKGEDLNTVFLQIYDFFIKPIDAIDNGIPQYKTKEKPQYSINTNISQRVSYLNPAWNATEKPDIDALFNDAMKLVGDEFSRCAKNYAEQWLPAKALVKDALEKRFEVDESGNIVKLERYCPWKSYIFELDVKEEILYVLFEGYGDWRITAVPVRKGDFENRKALPEKWRGLKDEELQKVCGVSGAIFVHATGFTGGNKTYEGALKMARLSVKATL